MKDRHENPLVKCFSCGKKKTCLMTAEARIPRKEAAEDGV